MSRPDPDPTATHDPLEDPRVAALVAEYQAERDAGRQPNRDALLKRHPDIAGVLAGCLRAVDFVHDAMRGTPPPPGTADLGAGSVIGDYRIVRPVGRGGMGVVFEAEQRSLGRRVALKVLPTAAGLDERSLRRFRHEALAAATLQHPHIVPVYAVGNDADVHYFVMQFIDGRSLADVVTTLRAARPGANTPAVNSFDVTVSHARTEPVGPAPVVEAPPALPDDRWFTDAPHYREAVRLIAQAADALQHAHENGIVHRDIKPGNLLLDARGELWVADFGLAKLPGSDLTGTADLMGTIRYMSPEQASGRAVALDGRADVYSLGVTLYELLALRPAFEAEDRRTLLRKVLDEEPVPPRKIDRAIPADLETITLKAMAKEPAERYQTAAAFRDDLRRFLDGRPVLARRQGWAERTWRWCRRYPVAAALTLGLFVATLSLGAVSLRLGRANADLRAANARETEALKRTFDALEAVVSGGAEDWLSEQRELTPRQREFFETAVRIYRTLSDAPGADPETQAQAARAMARLGLIKARLGQTEEGEAAVRDAIARQEALLARQPGDPDITRDLARSCWLLGDVLENREEWGAAAVVLDRAAELLRPVVAAYPGRVRDARILAAVEIDTGTARRQAGGPGAGIPAFTRAMALLERLLVADPGNNWIPYHAADCYHLLGREHTELGEYGPALEACDRGLTLIGPLARSPNADTPIVLTEAKLHITRAQVRVARKEPALALADYAAGEADLRRVLDRQPSYHAARRQLGLAFLRHGQLLADEDKPDEALARFADAADQFQQLCAAQKGLANPQHNLAWVNEERGNLFVHLRRWPEARAAFETCRTIWEPLTAKYPRNHHYPVGVADALRGLLLLPEAESPFKNAAERDRAAGRVVEMLNTAYAVGWRPGVRTRNEYRTSPKWQMFRDREDFRQFLAKFKS